MVSNISHNALAHSFSAPVHYSTAKAAQAREAYLRSLARTIRDGHKLIVHLAHREGLRSEHCHLLGPTVWEPEIFFRMHILSFAGQQQHQNMKQNNFFEISKKRLTETPLARAPRSWTVRREARSCFSCFPVAPARVFSKTPSPTPSSSPSNAGAICARSRSCHGCE